MGEIIVPQRTVHIVDSDTLHRRDVTLMVRKQGLDCHPFSQTADLEEALGYIQAGCVLMAWRGASPEADASTDDDEGPGAMVRSVLALRPEMAVIVMAQAPTIRDVVEALRAGAVDFLEIPIRVETLRPVLDHGFSILPARVAKQQRVGQATALTTQLTPREQEVLRGVVAGLTNRAIAERLHIGVRTVEMHRGNIMQKLQMDNLAALIRFAILTGILDQGLDAA
ncbi:MULTISPECIES: response regulator transcription factor [unclassified Novosphingobium]|uniref:response regulator transcription factor n=1 Tax=Novosphingobium TaxID=165696 RepID=UPI00144766B8|nr:MULTISPECIES: LuxR C-terminal-related transcriptional regulator [unclassified Novosphingobium]NKJ42030.1 two-component system response regulator FixJ [Novosphingobium sp. SG720]NMN04419.1 two-component system response regulator FixJ [Novosphingobium sp. SG919]NMN85590.1 two-component system response regulator FixJ [Novosphingobium sp. SG916]